METARQGLLRSLQIGWDATRQCRNGFPVKECRRPSMRCEPCVTTQPIANSRVHRGERPEVPIRICPDRERGRPSGRRMSEHSRFPSAFRHGRQRAGGMECSAESLAKEHGFVIAVGVYGTPVSKRINGLPDLSLREMPGVLLNPRNRLRNDGERS